jgi:molybdopterin biosynthesis enzyme
MVVAGMRIVPLYTQEDALATMEQIARDNYPVIRVAPFKLKNVGLIITGNEVYQGRIKDGFSPILHKKLEALGCTINNETIVPDDAEIIGQTIRDFKEKGSEIILCSSGMSVDPDDQTADGIRASGAAVRFYGLPVMAGTNLLYARLGDAHVMGIPACVLHSPATAFDRLFPIVMTGEELTKEATRKIGHGGLCLKCDECHYPVCPFGQ